MKRIGLIITAVIVLIMSWGLTSCDKNDGDVLKGTWKYNPDNTLYSSTSAATEPTNLYFEFDGKGNYTYTNKDEDFSYDGTYTIIGDSLVRTHYYRTYPSGQTKEGNEDYKLNLKSKPQTLTCHAYSSDGILLNILVFEKR